MIANDPPNIEVQEGLVAFFDILGFGEMLANNEPEEISLIIRDTFLDIPEKLNYDRMELGNYNLNPHYFIFSDSILVYQTKVFPGISEQVASERFVSYCCQLTADLLSSGLPVRGAISKGKFSIVKDQLGNCSFTGKCLIEAYKLGESLQLSGCAIETKLELEFSKMTDASFQKDLIRWQTFFKDLSAPTFLFLNYLNYMTQPNEVPSLKHLEDKFSQHKKGLPVEVLPKVKETEKFLTECKKASTPNDIDSENQT